MIKVCHSRHALQELQGITERCLRVPVATQAAEAEVGGTAADGLAAAAAEAVAAAVKAAPEVTPEDALLDSVAQVCSSCPRYHIQRVDDLMSEDTLELLLLCVLLLCCCCVCCLLHKTLVDLSTGLSVTFLRLQCSPGGSSLRTCRSQKLHYLDTLAGRL